MYWERKGGRKRGEKHRCTIDTSIRCLSHAPDWGPAPQPRHVPWLRIKPVTFQFAVWRSIHWGTPGRVGSPDFYFGVSWPRTRWRESGRIYVTITWGSSTCLCVNLLCDRAALSHIGRTAMSWWREAILRLWTHLWACWLCIKFRSHI